MIPRYSRPGMSAIWEPEGKYRRWLDVELAVCEILCERGEIPRKALATIRKRSAGGVDPARVDEIERTVKHDVIAFLTALAEKVGPDSRFVHLGLTSSDILDTALALQLRDAVDILLEDVRELLAVLDRLAHLYRRTPMIGRTHGIHAEPITFGLKLAVWYSEMERNFARLARAREAIAVGKVSGAVGTFAHQPLAVEEAVCRRLGLAPAPASTQVVQRDRHAEFFSSLAILGGTVEKIATEIRHLQRTEVQEAEEPFTQGQKGSSAMPHKRNPILSENLTGLARLLRSYALASLENQALWHERDISHSSVERVIGPDATIVADFMLARLKGLLDRLVVYPENMKRNLDRTAGLIFSGELLLALVRTGLAREEAYALVQRNAMRARDEGRPFLELLAEDPDVADRIAPDEVRAIMDERRYLTQVDAIFRRVFRRKGRTTGRAGGRSQSKPAGSEGSRPRKK